MLENFVKAFFKDNKPLLGVSITPEGMIEGVIYEAKNNTIVNYCRKELPFNPVKKMVEDTNELANILEEMISEMNILPKTQVVLNLPSFYFGFSDVDAYTQTQDEILRNIVSEVEQSYMFKQSVPVVDVCQMKHTWTQKPKVAFCAIQKNLLEGLKEIFEGLDLNIVAIENSYSSMIKALLHFGVIAPEKASNLPWGVISINQNSFSVFSFLGDNLYDIAEDAVAIKTYEKNEVDYAVASVIKNSLQDYNFEALTIVNNSAEVTAAELGKHFDGLYQKFCVIENNGTKNEQFCRLGSKIDIASSSRISLFALGAALYPLEEDYFLKFNLKKNQDEEEDEEEGFKLFGVPVELNDTNCLKMLFLAMILPAFIIGSLAFGAITYNNVTTDEINQLNKRIEDYNKQKEQYKITEVEETFDPQQEINNIMEANIYNRDSYNVLSHNIPKSTWLSYFYSNSYKATMIRGESSSTNDIYQFFRDIKKELNNKDLVLSKINVSDNAPNTYEFEITNKTYKMLIDTLKKSELNKDYRDAVSAEKKEKDAKYAGSILPIYPDSDLRIKSPILLDYQKEVDEELLRKLDDLETLPDNLPNI